MYVEETDTKALQQLPITKLKFFVMLNIVTTSFDFAGRSRHEPRATPSKEVSSTTGAAVNHRPPISGKPHPVNDVIKLFWRKYRFPPN